ncbi:acyltransferase family protein [Leptospira santarosai]|uniref:acyltransferase family protein n=1 Tax=Leptospira santarosai TaxID=28183 RepID=UPI0007746082|nr:acyltransferase [Leptospira santarosai]
MQARNKTENYPTHKLQKLIFFKDLFLNKNNEIGTLNGLRALAICFVLLNHFTIALKDILNLPAPLTLVYLNLWTGVDLFFVLSGFLISKGLWEEWQANSKLEIKKFYIKRILRIFPAYYFFLFVSYALGKGLLLILNKNHLTNEVKALSEALSNNWGDFVFLGNYIQGINTHTWSLSSEEQFYLIFPFFCSILLFKCEFKIRQALLWSLYLIPTIIRIYLIAYGDLQSTPPYFKEIYYPFHTRFDSFIIGIIAMDLYSNEKFHSIFKSNKILSLFLSGIFAFLLVIAHLIDSNSKTIIAHTLKYNLINIGYAGILLLSVSRDDSIYSKFLSMKLFNPIARLSYTIYLWHFIFMGIALKVLNISKADGSSLLFHLKFLGTLIITIILAIPLYYVIEVPFQKLRRKLI